jgi:hypothetical protein
MQVDKAMRWQRAPGQCLTIVDDFTKEAVDIVPDHSIPAST